MCNYDGYAAADTLHHSSRPAHARAAPMVALTDAERRLAEVGGEGQRGCQMRGAARCPTGEARSAAAPAAA